MEYPKIKNTDVYIAIVDALRILLRDFKFGVKSVKDFIRNLKR